MHRMIALVFKVLAINIIFFAVFDTATVALDSLTVMRRVDAVQTVMLREMQRNNSIPNASKGLFLNQLQSIVQRSNVAVSIDSNIEHSVTVNGDYYESVGEDNVKDYGTMLTSVISVEMRPRSILFSSTANTEGEFTAFNYFRYYQNHVENVPGLRYLK